MRIRPETTADHAAIREINIAAFAGHPFSQQTEHLIVEGLREAGALTLSLVAEAENRVAGHIAFSPAPISGQDLGWYLLGPIAVPPELQRRGIGKALALAGLEALQSLGAQGCVLVGDPGFYTRFGFRQAIGLRYPGVPREVVLCLPLAGAEPQGAVGHHPAFEAKPEGQDRA